MYEKWKYFTPDKDLCDFNFAQQQCADSTVLASNSNKKNDKNGLK